MKISDIITEDNMTSMSELFDFWTEFNKLDYLIFDTNPYYRQNNQICLDFFIDGYPGFIVLQADSNKYKKLLMSAAIAASGGKKPKSPNFIWDFLRGRIYGKAIKILTNKKNWSIVTISHPYWKYGQSLH